MRYQSNAENTDRGLSPGIWHDILAHRLDDPSQVGFFFDDFQNFSQHVSDQDVQQYSSYIDTGVTLKQLAVEDRSEGEYGLLEVAGNDADNDEGSIITGGNSGTLALISDTSGQDFMLGFECRIKKASIADNALAFFIGLSEEGLAAADTLVNDTGEVADKDFIGFQVLHAEGEQVNSIFRKAGQAKQTVKANVETLVADTWVKLGFLWQPGEVTAQRIAFFVNGVKQADYVTGTQIAAATFPDGEELALLLATKVGAAAESKFQMDWWAVGQMLF